VLTTNGRAGRLVLLILLVLLGTGVAWRLWQGPVVTGYRLDTRPLVQKVVASGEVASQSIARVGSEITGVVASRHVREGDLVERGELLITLHDEELQARVKEAEAALRQLAESARPQAQAALVEAEERLTQASRERRRRDDLFRQGSFSAEQREQASQNEVTARAARDRARIALEALAPGGSEEQVVSERRATARAALAKTLIHAEVTGIVQTRAVEPGDLVQPGHTLLEIARLDSSEILLPLDEKHLAPVATGQSARVVADAYPERVLAAQVSFIAPAIDTARGTIDVHLSLLEPADFLRQGMTVSVNIFTGERDAALVIPNDALRQREGHHATALRVADGAVEEVAVRLGLLGTGLSEVLEGLEAGDRVLIQAAEPGARIRFRERPLPNGAAP